MVHVNVHEARTHLSRYLEQVEKGETIILCRNNRPVAEIRLLATAGRKVRRFGLDRGIVVIHPEFYEPLDEETLGDLCRW
jgi:antitoxin (DNA-binding transcriptional repressor) of toxin-antitoxin stability system